MSKPVYVERPTPVEVVRPNPTWQRAAISTADFFLRTWLVMMVLPLAFPHSHIGFWQVAGLLAIYTWVTRENLHSVTRLPKRVIRR